MVFRASALISSPIPTSPMRSPSDFCSRSGYGIPRSWNGPLTGSHSWGDQRSGGSPSASGGHSIRTPSIGGSSGSSGCSVGWVTTPGTCYRLSAGVSSAGRATSSRSTPPCALSGSLSPFVALFVVPVGGVAEGLSLFPGGLGSIESSQTLLLVLLTGVSIGAASVVVLLFRVSLYWFRLVVGAACLFYLGVRDPLRADEGAMEPQ